MNWKIYFISINTNKLATINPMSFHTLLNIILHDDVELCCIFPEHKFFISSLKFPSQYQQKILIFSRLNKIRIWYFIDFFLMPNASLRSLNHRKVINLIEQFFLPLFYSLYLHEFICACSTFFLLSRKSKASIYWYLMRHALITSQSSR